MTMKSLTEIANYYGTDKGTIGPSVGWIAHNYTDIYESYLWRYRQASINLLEIGLGVTGQRWDAQIVHGRNKGGASIKMWYDYFPNANIYGIDINPSTFLENDRIRTFAVDQGNKDDLINFLKSIGKIEFEVIIDDGSHRPDHQQITLSILFERLKSGGLYFIEDLLSNGLGDNYKGRMACDNVRNSRSILKYYSNHGEFAEPNAFINPEYLEDNIDRVFFHVPRISVSIALQANFRRPIRKVVKFRPDSESLCLIVKK